MQCVCSEFKEGPENDNEETTDQAAAQCLATMAALPLANLGVVLEPILK